MALYALGTMRAEFFTPESQKDDDNPTRFKIKGVDGANINTVMEGATFRDDMLFLSASGIRAALKFGLVDWENMLDPETESEIKFKQGKIRLIPWKEQQEIASEIVDRSNLMGEQTKNS